MLLYSLISFNVNWDSAMTESEVISFVRIILGGVDETTLPDEVILLFYNRWVLYFDLENNPEKLPYVLHNTVVSCLQWLITKSTACGNTYTSRTEKIGDEQISTSNGVSQVQAWKDLLDYILANPDYVDPSLSNGLENLVIIGGVRQDRFDEVKNDTNSRGPYSEEGLVSYTEKEVSSINGLVYRDWPRRYR